MSRPGLAYQDVVAAVQRALDPGATVKVGQWIEGPDGRREVDVEVRGTRDGVPHFALVECKDWKPRVDIQAIDALDSKGRDLGADSLALYSNSGFTKKALAKARRLDIACASAMMEGNQTIRLVVQKYFIAKALRVNHWFLELFFPQEEASRIPEAWDARDLEYEGRPVVNWLSNISRDLLVQHDGLRLVVATWAFHQPTPFRFPGADFLLTGLRLRLTCDKRWLGQLVAEDVTTGLYDHVRRAVVVPNEQAYTIGPFDQEAWEEIVEASDRPDLRPGEFRLEAMPVSEHDFSYAAPA